MAGCNDGKLTDPRAWFFDRIQRQPGQAANDWDQVLRGAGLEGGPGPGQQAGQANYGITVQKDGGGNIRPRLFLPTAQPDSNGYFTREVDVVAGNPGAFSWKWEDRGGNAYAPRDCGSVPHPEPQPVPQPSDPTDLVAVHQKLDRIELALAAIAVRAYVGEAEYHGGTKATVKLHPEG